jgi:hypothetical protein
MNLDIRMPMGIMFTLFGVVLVIWGAFSNGDPMYQRSLGININLIWGVVLLAFGGLMVIFARRATGKKSE